MRYPGGKNNSGSYQHIISEIPLTDVYVELFYGSGAVWRYMRPARVSYLVDLDASVLPAENAMGPGPYTHSYAGSALDFLDTYPFIASDVVYADPPYLFEARRSGDRGIYAFEFGEREQHIFLLRRLCQMPCRVLLSGYASELYESMLQGWRVKSWNVRTRGGNATEWLWCNFPTPSLLQDARYVGQNYTQRQRLRRRAGVEAR